MRILNKNTVGIGAFCVGGLLLSAASQAMVITKVVAFGDSLTDNGNLYAATGGDIPPSPPYYQGRQSNGPTWVEQLSTSLGSRLNDYAIAGATTGTFNVWDPVHENAPFGGIQDQIDAYTGSGVDPRALHFLWGGSNNFLRIPDDPFEAIRVGVTDLVTAVGTLKGYGASNLFVLNMPDLGLTPRLLESGLSAAGTALTDGFNGALAAGLAGNGFGDVPIIDTATILRETIANPEEYGFTNTTDACIKIIEGALVYSCSLDPTQDEDEYVFWDDVHPTRITHGVFADKVSDVLGPVTVPEPGSLALLMMGFLGITVTRLSRGARLKRQSAR